MGRESIPNGRRGLLKKRLDAMGFSGFSGRGSTFLGWSPATPGCTNLPDDALIGIVANPPALMGDCDEVVAVAAINLPRRLGIAEAC